MILATLECAVCSQKCNSMNRNARSKRRPPHSCRGKLMLGCTQVGVVNGSLLAKEITKANSPSQLWCKVSKRSQREGSAGPQPIYTLPVKPAWAQMKERYFCLTRQKAWGHTFLRHVIATLQDSFFMLFGSDNPNIWPLLSQS